MTIAAPEALAAQWLGKLSATERLAAVAHTDARLWAWLSVGLAVLAVAGVAARADLMGRLRRAIERQGAKPWLSRAAAAGALTALLLAAKAPLDGLWAWREASIGAGAQTVPPLTGFLFTAASGVIPAAGVAVVLVPSLQWLILVRPRAWPWIAGAIAAVFIVAAGWGPYASSLGAPTASLPDGPVRQGLAMLARAARTPDAAIRASSDPAFVADVTGGVGPVVLTIGPSLASAPPAEARALVGHLLGHFAHWDVLTVNLVYAGLVLASLLAIQRLHGPTARFFGLPRTTRLADPEGLPVAALLGVLAVASATVLSGAYLRWVNVRADAYSLALAQEPDGLAQGLVEEWDHEDVAPSPFEEALFYTHPSLRGRLVHIMAWKQNHSR